MLQESLSFRKDRLVAKVESQVLNLQKKNNEFESVYTTSGNVKIDKKARLIL